MDTDGPTARTGLFERWGARVAAAGFVAAMAVASLLPVYTDELGWRFQERAGYAPGLDTLYSDLCGPTSLVRPPLFMMPSRWLSATLNGLFPDPLFIRAEGVVLALAFAALLWRLARRAGPGPAGLDLRTIGLALLGIGMLPLLLAMSRPEQVLILSLGAAILIALRGADTAGEAWRNGAVTVLLAVLALSCHIKGVVYAPVFAACIAAGARGRGTGWPRIAALAALGVLTLVAAQYWSARMACPGNAVIAAKYAQQNVAARLASAQGLGDLGAILAGANPFQYIVLAGPQRLPMSNWVPAGAIGDGAAAAMLLAVRIAWGAALALGILCLEQFVLREKRRAMAEPRALVALAIFAVVLVWGASQVVKNVYEASHVLPMLAVATVLSLSLRGRDSGLVAKVARPLGIGLLAIALVTQVAVAALYAPPLRAAHARPGVPAGQPVSLSLAGYGQVRSDIGKAMRLAGIPTDRPLHRPLLDDTTYLALQQSRLPFHALGVIRIWHDRSIEPAGYLLSRRSDGMVVGCAMLPDHLRRVAARSGEVCAIGPATLARISRRSYPPPAPYPQ